METKEPIKLRGHHLVRLYLHKVFPASSGVKLIKFETELLANESLEVILTTEPDVICDMCPDKRKAECYKENVKVDKLYDGIVTELLGLSLGKVYLVKDLLYAIGKRTTFISEIIKYKINDGAIKN